MGNEASKDSDAKENSLLHDEADDKNLKSSEGVTPMADGDDEDDFAIIAAEADVAETGDTAKRSNEAQGNTREDEDEGEVIEIDEYTRRMTIIQEHIYHYVGLVSGREYAKEMGMEAPQNGEIPQVPMEFLIQEIKKRKSLSSSTQPDQTKTKRKKTEAKKKRSPEHSGDGNLRKVGKEGGKGIDDVSEKIFGKELEAEAKEEALVKNPEFKTKMKHLEREDSSTGKERNNCDETEQNVDRHKVLPNNSTKSKNNIGDNLVKEKSKRFSDSDQIPKNKDNLNLGPYELVPRVTMDEGPFNSGPFADSCSDPDWNSSLQEKNRSAEHAKPKRQDALSAQRKNPSSDAEDTSNSNGDIASESFTAESKVSVKATEAIKSDSTEQMATVYLPSVEQMTSGESEQNGKSDSKAIYSTMMIVGPKRKNTSQPNRRNSKQKIGADENETNVDETDSRLTLGDAARQDGVTRSRSSKQWNEAAMTPDLKSNDGAEVRDKIEKLTEGDSGSYLKPTEKQIISTIYVVPMNRNPDEDFETTATPADCSTADENSLRMSKYSKLSLDSGSSDGLNDEKTLSSRGKSANKSTNRRREMDDIRLDEVDSIVDDFELPEDVTWKKPYSPSKNHLIYRESKKGDDSFTKRQNFDDGRNAYSINCVNDPALILDTSVTSSTNRMLCELVPSDETTAPNRGTLSTDGRTTEPTESDASSSSAETGNDVTGQNNNIRNFVRQNEKWIEGESAEVKNDQIKDLHSFKVAANIADETKTKKKTENKTEKETEKKTEKETGKKTEKETEKKTENKTEKETGKKTEKETEKKAEKKTEKETEKKTEKKTGKNALTANNSPGKYKENLKMSSENLRSENVFHSDESEDSNAIEPTAIDALRSSPSLNKVRCTRNGETEAKNKKFPVSSERLKTLLLDAETDTTDHNENAYVDPHTTQNTFAENEDNERERKNKTPENFDVSIDAPLQMAIKPTRQNAELYAAVPVTTNDSVQAERTVGLSTSQGPFHNELLMNQPDERAAERVVSLCDRYTQTSEAGEDVVVVPPPKTKSLTRSRSVGFREPEVIPDFRPTRVCAPIAATSTRTPVRHPRVDRKTKIPLVARKSCPKVTTAKKESTVDEKKPSSVNRKETQKKTPLKAVAVSSSGRPKTLHVPGTTAKSTTTARSTGHGSSGSPAVPKVVPSPKVTRKKEDMKSSSGHLQKRSPPSKSMECIPRCTCLQISGKKDFAKSISSADPEKYGTQMSKHKSCEALHSTRHPDNPLGLREYGFSPPSKRPHWK